MLFNRLAQDIPTRDQALAGRAEQPFRLSERHRVLDAPLVTDESNIPDGHEVAVFGLGVAAGSLVGAKGGTVAELKRRYLAGLALTGAAFFASGLAPAYAVALFTFALAGIGNGLVLVHGRLLFQQLVPERLLGRAFGVNDTIQCWAFAPGFVCAGVLASLFGTRTLFYLAGAGALIVWGLASLTLRRIGMDACRPRSLLPARPALAES